MTRGATGNHLRTSATRVVAEPAEHAVHAYIIRETIDARGGLDRDDIGNARWWTDYVGRIQAAAETFT